VLATLSVSACGSAIWGVVIVVDKVNIMGFVVH